jgi:hypothetical protein
MKVAYIFATSGRTISRKLSKMILPQLETSTHGATNNAYWISPSKACRF